MALDKQEWEPKFFSVAGLRCAVLTGDTNTSLTDCLSTDIILSTPEKVFHWKYSISWVVTTTCSFTAVGLYDKKMEKLFSDYREHKTADGAFVLHKVTGENI